MQIFFYAPLFYLLWKSRNVGSKENQGEQIERYRITFGTVIVGDAPMQECVFENISGLDDIVKKYKTRISKIEVVDFRELKSEVKNGVHITEINTNADGVIINLGEDSLFYGSGIKEQANMRITNYDPRILKTHHIGEVQEYYVSRYILNADVIINMPKPKTHRKAGVTIALKNFVGINTRKEYLPHHTIGSLSEGGDEYLKRSIIHSLRSKLFDKKNILEAEKNYAAARLIGHIILLLSACLKITGNNKYSEGSWYGNDTISRTISDLNRIVLYADKRGVIHENKQRELLIVADMIISGEKEGPVAPTPKKVGLIAAGTNQVCFDQVVCNLMGFDYTRIPTITRAMDDNHRLPILNHMIPYIVSNVEKYNNKKLSEISKNDLLKFIPTDGWKDHIEIKDL